MIPRLIAGASVVYGAPASHPEVRDLHIRIERLADGTPVFASAWEPTPEELALLAAGGSVVLRVVSMQPPVSLAVEPSVEEVPHG